MDAAAPRILLVEDDRNSIHRIERLISSSLGCATFNATTAQQAWQAIESNDIQLVVANWMLPDSSGPELCRRIRQASLDRYVYFILLTGRTGVGSLRKGLEFGADEFLRKPVDSHELELRIRAGLRIVKLEHDLQQRNQELNDAYGEISRAVKSASRTQQHMLPDAESVSSLHSKTGLRIAYEYQACQSLGGDVLGIGMHGEAGVALFVADISGHGIEASMAAVSLHALLKSLVSKDSSLVNWAVEANMFCSRELPHEIYSTAVLLSIDADTHEAGMVIAGHPPVLLQGSDGTVRSFESNMPPLGMFEDGTDDLQPYKVRLSAGDRLIIYTDGVVESRNQQGEMFAEDLLESMISGIAEARTSDLPGLLTSHLQQWRGPGVEADDDITVLAAMFDEPA